MKWNFVNVFMLYKHGYMQLFIYKHIKTHGVDVECDVNI